jgi:hypothetical protein
MTRVRVVRVATATSALRVDSFINAVIGPTTRLG